MPTADNPTCGFPPTAVVRGCARLTPIGVAILSLFLPLSVAVLGATEVAMADEFSFDQPLAAKLSTPYHRIADGKPFREGLHDIASQTKLNLWVDRLVDPTTPIDVGTVGPTVLGAIEKIAEGRGCVVMPIANVVLVGKPTWVDHTSAAILAWGELSRHKDVSDFHWEDLTTPFEALTQVVGDEVRVNPELPHDLWPANSWSQLDRRVAITLILAQFGQTTDATDIAPIAGKLNLRLKAWNDRLPAAVTRRYTGKDLKAIGSAMRRVDGGTRVRNLGRSIEVTGSLAAHRAGICGTLRKAGTLPDVDDPIFQLKQTQATAEALLREFSKIAGVQCKIDPAAMPACQQPISIETTGETSLRTLIEMVAERAGVRVRWENNSLLVSRDPS